MRTIERTAKFKRDYKREAKGKHREDFQSEFMQVIQALVNEEKLPQKYRDHALTGE